MIRIDKSELERLVGAIFAAAGSGAEEAAAIADHLVEANLMGHDSHGVSRVIRYIEYLEAGTLFPNRRGRVVLDTGAIAVMDGDLGYGQVIGGDAVELGVGKARELGVGVVGLKNVGHLGRIGAWAERAATAGMVSLHFVNTTGLGMKVAPFGGVEARMSTNPIAVGIPRADGPPVIFDAATSVVAEGKVFVARNEGKHLPMKALYDNEGRPSDDPAALYGDPPGAIAAFGLHKGSGLCFVTDLLAGALTGGGATRPEVTTLANNMLSIYIAPERFGETSYLSEETARFIDWVRSSRPVAAGGEILLPGEPERRTRRERFESGVPLDEETWQSVLTAARRVGLNDDLLPTPGN